MSCFMADHGFGECRGKVNEKGYCEGHMEAAYARARWEDGYARAYMGQDAPKVKGRLSRRRAAVRARLLSGSA